MSLPRTRAHEQQLSRINVTLVDYKLINLQSERKFCLSSKIFIFTFLPIPKREYRHRTPLLSTPDPSAKSGITSATFQKLQNTASTKKLYSTHFSTCALHRPEKLAMATSQAEKKKERPSALRSIIAGSTAGAVEIGMLLLPLCAIVRSDANERLLQLLHILRSVRLSLLRI